MKLQGESQDILNGVSLLEECSLNLKEIQKNVDDYLNVTIDYEY